jgi:hypothetical protein
VIRIDNCARLVRDAGLAAEPGHTTYLPAISGGQSQRPNQATAAEKLGVSVEALRAVLGEPGQGPSDPNDGSLIFRQSANEIPQGSMLLSHFPGFGQSCR